MIIYDTSTREGLEEAIARVTRDLDVLKGELSCLVVHLAVD
jgi:hypothetical protein